MFNNLIESASHRKEFKRRGSFFLVTTATYALMLVLTGVASIYAYDARLEDQVYEQVITMLPPESAPAKPVTPTDPKPTSKNDKSSDIAERKVAMFDVDRPEIVPEKISAEPNKVQPLPNGPVKITGRDYDPPVAVTTGPGTERTVVQPPRIEIPDELPPPTPPQPPKDRVVKVSRVLNSEALSLPKPRYPALALQIHLEGVVNVQVLIDETGKVVSAKAVNGHPMLVPDAVRAANQARFSPTIINDQPVKVSGVISYNFKLSN